MKPSTILALCAFGALVAHGAFAAGTATTAEASPLDASAVPAKAQIVGHVDLDAFRSSQLAKTFAAELLDARKQLASQLKAEKIPLDADDLFNASGVTFWAEGDDTEKGALIVSGINGSKFARAIAKLPDHKSLGGGMHQVDDTYVGLKGNRMVVADDRTSVEATLEVLSGRGKSMAQSKKASRLKASGVLVIAAFEEAIAKKIKKEASSAIFNNVSLKRGTVTVAESNKALVAKAVLETTDAAGANQLHKLAAGAISFFSVASDDPELGKILDGVDVKSSGTKVTFTIKLPIDQLKNLAKVIN